MLTQPAGSRRDHLPLPPHAEGETSQITFTKSGAPKCNKCGHYLRGDEHPGRDGLFHSTVWCTCDCYERFDRDGKPRPDGDPVKKLYEIERSLGLRP